MSYQLIEDLKKEADRKVPVSQACQILQVSRSNYYAKAAAHQRRLGVSVVCAASVHLKAAFTASHKAYGSRRLRAAMAERGMAIGRHSVCTLMRLNGWLYLAAVLDLHSRKIVGWAMATAIPAALVRAALQMAIAQRNPAFALIMHSDRAPNTPALNTRRYLPSTAWWAA